MTQTLSSSGNSTKGIPDPESWAVIFARRLRCLQTSLSEEPQAIREDHLFDELEKELRFLPVAQRADYIDALAEHFPDWRADETHSTTPQRNPLPPTFEELLNQLSDIAPNLTNAQKEAAVARLVKLNIIREMPRQALGAEEFAEVLKRLNLPPDAPIDGKRLGRLFFMLCETMLAFDQLAWNVWRAMAPSSLLRRDSMQPELQLLLARSITGDNEASASLVQQQVEKTRKLVAALLSSTEAVGRDFGTFYHEKFSPTAIKEYVRSLGKSGLFDNPDARAWACYIERAAHLSAPAIEREVKKQLVQSTEELIQGIKR